MSVYNLEQIKEIIPHREPFIMIDSIEELEPGIRAVGRKRLTGREEYFAGHFPGNPVMPGVLQIEAMAQTGAVALLDLEEWKGKTAYFLGIDKAKFKRKIVPGDELIIETKIIKAKGPMGIGEGTIRVDGELACKAELTFAVGD